LIFDQLGFFRFRMGFEGALQRQRPTSQTFKTQAFKI
jgi:hypothetical protein